MRILKVEPGKAPYAKEMEEGLKAIQREVEGLFHPLSMGDGVILCCNDEGKLNGMQPNRRLGDDIICGMWRSWCIKCTGSTSRWSTVPCIWR